MPTSKVRQAFKLDPERQRKVLDRVRQRMAELPGMTVRELVRRSHLTPSTFYNYEAGKRPLDMETVREFERVLYLPPGELFKIAGWLPGSLEDFAQEPAAIRIVIEQHPDLTAAEKRSFLLQLDSYLAEPQKRRRRRGGS